MGEKRGNMWILGGENGIKLGKNGVLGGEIGFSKENIEIKRGKEREKGE